MTTPEPSSAETQSEKNRVIIFDTTMRDGEQSPGASMSLDEKLELAKTFGATHGYNITGKDSAGKDLFKLTGGGADYAFDCVGMGKISELAWGVLRRGGTAVIVGIAGPKEQIALNSQQVAMTEKTLTGSFYGGARPQLDFPRLIGLYRSGRLKLDELITRTYSIDEAPRAFADLNAGKQGRGVIIFDAA